MRLALLLILPLVLLLVLLVIYSQLQISRVLTYPQLPSVSNSTTPYIQQLDATIKVEWGILSDPQLLEPLAREIEEIFNKTPAAWLEENPGRVLRENLGRAAILEVIVTVTNNAQHGEIYVTGSPCTSSIKEAVMKIKEVKEARLTFADILVRPIKGKVYGGPEICLAVLAIEPLSGGESAQNVFYYVILRPENGESFEAEFSIRIDLCKSAGGGCEKYSLTVKVDW